MLTSLQRKQTKCFLFWKTTNAYLCVRKEKNELKKCDKYQTFQVKNINTPPPTQKNEKKSDPQYYKGKVFSANEFYYLWDETFIGNSISINTFSLIYNNIE